MKTVAAANTANNRELACGGQGCVLVLSPLIFGGCLERRRPDLAGEYPFPQTNARGMVLAGRTGARKSVTSGYQKYKVSCIMSRGLEFVV